MPFLSSFQIGFTSAPGQGGILAQREFDRRFSPHFVSSAVSSFSSPGMSTRFWLWEFLVSLEDLFSLLVLVISVLSGLTQTATKCPDLPKIRDFWP